jgi:serine/threonine-protein kinase HipA
VKRCPITYEVLPSGFESRYSQKGLRQLAPALTHLDDLPYSADEQRHEAMRRATKMSIQGVQPKLSARLAVKKGTFEIVDQGGRYILKPQSDHYPSLPENEDVTMRLAATVGIEVPLHGLLYSRDGTLTYFIRRFDRRGTGRKIAVEDFAQLAGRTRDTKYDFSMERLVGVIDRFATFPAVARLELFRRTLFSFVTGNEDMHLKNFSLIVDEDRTVKLSPAYDLLNTTIALPRATEELALPVNGKKRRLGHDDLVDYFGRNRLGLTERSIEGVLAALAGASQHWPATVHETSFLPENLKTRYVEVLEDRLDRLRLA